MTNPEAYAAGGERIALPRDISRARLEAILRAGNIPVDEYGVGTAKSIDQLLVEINEGESVLTVDQEQAVRREVGVLWLDVLCELADGKVYLLKEARQVIKRGRDEEVKERKIDSSLGEKLKPSEDPLDAVWRALSEELGVQEAAAVYKIDELEKTRLSNAFPGIESTYNMHKFVTVIPVTEFKPKGYVEQQEDKTSYFEWELIHTPKQAEA